MRDLRSSSCREKVLKSRVPIDRKKQLMSKPLRSHSSVSNECYLPPQIGNQKGEFGFIYHCFFTEKMFIAVTTVVLCVLGVIGATSELWIPLCQRYFRDFVNRRATRSIYVTIAILFEIMKIVFACVCICLSLMLKCAHPYVVWLIFCLALVKWNFCLHIV